MVQHHARVMSRVNGSSIFTTAHVAHHLYPEARVEEGGSIVMPPMYWSMGFQ
jgi:hypothetical protein